MFSLKTIFFSAGLLVLLIGWASLPGMLIPTLFQPPQTPDATPSAWQIEAESLPLPPEVGTPERDTLAPITVENANQLSSLSAWSPLPQEEDPDWQLGPIAFNPHSTLLTRLKTGHIFFGMGIWHLWDVTSPFAPRDLDTISGTGYDYTFWTYADTVFTDTGYARASMSVEFSNTAQDWGGSATPNTRWITYQQSGGPNIIVQQDYHAQQYSPQVWLKLSADGCRLMAYSSGRLYVWDASQQRILAEISLGDPPYLVGFSPDNRYIVTIEDEAFVVRRIEADKLVQVLNIPRSQAEMLPVPQFMPNDTTHFVKAAGREVEMWDLDTQTLVYTVMVPCVSIRQIAFNPDGTLLAISVDCSTTAGHDPSEILLWDARTMTEVAAIPATIDISDLAFSPDGYLLAVGDVDQTELWGIQTE
jgi:WD40 repeat protein